MNQGWQHKAAFVIQFRQGTDVKNGRFEGVAEHIASCDATRFHSLDELLGFIGDVLTEVTNAEQPSSLGGAEGAADPAPGEAPDDTADAERPSTSPRQKRSRPAS